MKKNLSRSRGVTILVLLVGSACEVRTQRQEDQRPIPTPPALDWFDNAKLGLLIHWGPYSVPGWAPPSGEYGELTSESNQEWYRLNPYSEWYQNTMSVENAPTGEYHRDTYGADYPYSIFGSLFQDSVEQWDAGAWADLFKASGAKYVIITAKHHDGFLLWPSQVPHPLRNEMLDWKLQRDVLGELRDSLWDRNIRFGLYYSHGLDWTFGELPIENKDEFEASKRSDTLYLHYILAHWLELIRSYTPDLVWADVPLAERVDPIRQKMQDLLDLYGEQVPWGIVNDRFLPSKRSDFATTEYSIEPEIRDDKWETTRGLGLSFGFNRAERSEHLLTGEQLIELLVNVVSKNGNLLLGVGPQADGTISELQAKKLDDLGRWLNDNGASIYGTRPWVQDVAATVGGGEVRFTSNGENLFVFLISTPECKRDELCEVTIEGLSIEQGASVDWLTTGQALSWSNRNGGVQLNLGRDGSRGPVSVLSVPIVSASWKPTGF